MNSGEPGGRIERKNLRRMPARQERDHDDKLPSLRYTPGPHRRSGAPTSGAPRGVPPAYGVSSVVTCWTNSGLAQVRRRLTLDRVELRTGTHPLDGGGPDTVVGILNGEYTGAQAVRREHRVVQVPVTDPRGCAETPRQNDEDRTEIGVAGFRSVDDVPPRTGNGEHPPPGTRRHAAAR